MFDATSFLDQSVTEANDTQVTPIPVGEYNAIIDKVTARQWTAKDDPTKSGITLDVVWLIDDQGVKELLGREKVTIKQGLMLDLTEAGGLDMGKGRNVGLGKLRQAVGLNAPGQPFSFSMLAGRMGRISTGQRVDQNDSEKIYSEVKAVAPL